MNQPVQTVAQHGYMQRAGVCRDFGNLAMTLCGALYIPARQFAGAAPFKEPPPNFHALFEVCVSDCWIFLGATYFIYRALRRYYGQGRGKTLAKWFIFGRR